MDFNQNLIVFLPSDNFRWLGCRQILDIFKGIVDVDIREIAAIGSRLSIDSFFLTAKDGQLIVFRSRANGGWTG